jgi:hypothetical protein
MCVILIKLPCQLWFNLYILIYSEYKRKLSQQTWMHTISTIFFFPPVEFGSGVSSCGPNIFIFKIRGSSI